MKRDRWQYHSNLLRWYVGARARAAALALLLFMLLVVFAFFAPIAHGQTLKVKEFPGADVGTKTTNAQAACQSGLSVCVLIFEAELASFPNGAMPSRCVTCTWFDYRSPGGPALPKGSGIWSDFGELNDLSKACGYSVWVPIEASTALRTDPQVITTASRVVGMWFTCAKTGTIGMAYAESVDGIHEWKCYNSCNNLIASVAHSSVAFNGGTYHFLVGASLDGNGDATHIDYYTSTSGVNPALITANVIVPSGGWETALGNNSFVFDSACGGVCVAYEGGSLGGGYKTGIAQGATLSSLTEYGSNPVTPYGFSGPQLLKISTGNWMMFGHKPKGTAISPVFPSELFAYKASAPTGPWTVVGDEYTPIIPRERAEEGADWSLPSGFTSGQLADPQAQEMDGRTLLYATASGKGTHTIKVFVAPYTIAQIYAMTAQGRSDASGSEVHQSGYYPLNLSVGLLGNRGTLSGAGLLDISGPFSGLSIADRSLTSWTNGAGDWYEWYTTGKVFSLFIAGGSSTVTIDATANLSTTGSLKAPLYKSTTNCAAVGSAANPSVAACTAAPSGAFSCATAASGGTCQVTTTAVTATSNIIVQQVVSEGARLSVTCNTASVLPATPLLLSKSAGTSFTLTMGTITTNPACFVFWIVN